MTYDFALVLAGRTLTLMGWFVLVFCTSVLAGVGLEERRPAMIWSAFGIAALIVARVVVFVLESTS